MLRLPYYFYFTFPFVRFFFFFFNDTAPTEIYTLPLHDALPISLDRWHRLSQPEGSNDACRRFDPSLRSLLAPPGSCPSHRAEPPAASVRAPTHVRSVDPSRRHARGLRRCLLLDGGGCGADAILSGYTADSVHRARVLSHFCRGRMGAVAYPPLLNSRCPGRHLDVASPAAPECHGLTSALS